MRIFYVFLLMTLFAFSLNAQWIKQSVTTTSGFRGLSVVSEKVVWVSGTGGTFLKTVDGGKTWTTGQVAGAEKLDFRDVEAFDDKTAYLLSIGNGETSRIYKTVDGGKTWEMQFKANDTAIFLDALAFWDKNNGLAMGDPVKGFFYLLITNDGGKTWQQLPTDKMFPAKDGEAAFAASGTCIFTQGKNNVWLVSGGKAARVFYSVNRGNSWLAKDSPIISGKDSQGIFSIAMFNAQTGVIVGGDYQKPDEAVPNLAFTNDGGVSWKEAKGFNGYRSGVTFVDKKTLIAVGSSGSDISYDGGKTWKTIDKENYNAVQAKGKKAVWAVGANGLIAKFSMK